VKRSSRHSAAFSRGLALLVVLAATSCGPRVANGPGATRGVAVCARLDSSLASALPPRPWTLRGRAIFDVEDYRVRGRFTLAVASGNRVTFNFEGTTLFGGHHEDITVSLDADTLRLLDRERGAFYEGAAIDDLIDGGTGVRGDWADIVRVSAGFAPACDARSIYEDQGDALSGLVAAGAFVLTLDSDRLVRASWPDPTASRTYSDRLDLRYDWNGRTLRGVTIRLPVRGWRVVLAGD
jgi:hypothetical protein